MADETASAGDEDVHLDTAKPSCQPTNIETELCSSYRKILSGSGRLVDMAIGHSGDFVRSMPRAKWSLSRRPGGASGALSARTHSSSRRNKSRAEQQARCRPIKMFSPLGHQMYVFLARIKIIAQVTGAVVLALHSNVLALLLFSSSFDSPDQATHLGTLRIPRTSDIALAILKYHPPFSVGAPRSDMAKYADAPEWLDIVPIPQDEGGPNPLAAIAYTEEYSEAMSYLRAVMAKNEMSERALDLTEDVIGMNPAHYTVW